MSPNPRRMLLVSALGLVFVWQPVAHATVYSWKGAGGVRMLSNNPRDVPADQQASAQKFTAKPAPRPAPDEERFSTAEAAPRDAYQRGFDAGLQAADREVALAGELARTVLAALPERPPAPIIIEQSAPPVAPDYASDYAAYAPPPPYYGGVGAYAPYSFPYLSPYPFPYAFTVGFPQRNFFPGAHGHRFGSFFPHRQFSRAWTGRMR